MKVSPCPPQHIVRGDINIQIQELLAQVRSPPRCWVHETRSSMACASASSNIIPSVQNLTVHNLLMMAPKADNMSGIYNVFVCSCLWFLENHPWVCTRTAVQIDSLSARSCGNHVRFNRTGRLSVNARPSGLSPPRFYCRSCVHLDQVGIKSNDFKSGIRRARKLLVKPQ